ncbi:MAG: glycoside hydrolase family 3 N-terminal domain-containing protein, partial [Lacibacter sp.]
MKYSFIIAFASLVFIKATAQQSSVSNEAKAAALVKKMTLEEKVGQMTQITLAVIAKGSWANEDGSLDAVALKKAVTTYKVGSILNSTAHALPVETWRSIITQIQDEAQNTRLKIPVLYGLDGIHGQTYTLNATLFPQNLAMAATRNPALVSNAAKVTAKELRSSGVRWNFAPVLDVARQPLWSRFPETYGEDVYLVKTMGAAAVKAYEEDGLKNPTAVAVSLKHYLGYSAPRSGKDRTPAYIPEIELREYYLPPFREAVKTGAASVMVNSAEINGTPVHASKYLLTDVLRKELGFRGVVVTDWEDIKRLHNWHKVAASPREAVAMAVNAGIDMSMVPSDFSFYDLLIEAVKKGEVPLNRIDDAVTRILTMKFNLGLFDFAYPEPASFANFGNAAYQQQAYTAALEAMTLLKNANNVLPLTKQMKVLVAGPAAQSLSALNGCWSYTWQGNDDRWYPADSKTIYQTIAEKVGAANCITTTEKGFDAKANYDADAITKAATSVDVIVLCIGENAYAESPGTTRDLALPKEQEALVYAAARTGKPVILVLTEGRPRFITNIEPHANGILLAYWSGRKTAEAVADVLFGDYNPNGRLPFTYHKSMGEIVLYDRKHSEEIREVFNDNIGTGYEPLYPFGHGLSYTTFAYSNLQLSTKQLTATGKLNIRVTIKNTGSREGMHSVELYTADLYASVTPSVRRLRACKKVNLKPGEETVVTFELDRTDL